MPSLRLMAAMLALAALAGCSALQATDRLQDRANSQRERSDAALNAFRDQVRDHDRARGQVVDLPWVAGRPQPLAREVTLPLALRANVKTTMLFESGATISPR
ncbi:hypothetical protein RBI22_05300 [Alcaligenaceae bacterium C4P045]|nr:hypothetical protein [Alcaligenaceae bacterium C4P045]